MESLRALRSDTVSFQWKSEKNRFGKEVFVPKIQHHPFERKNCTVTENYLESIKFDPIESNDKEEQLRHKLAGILSDDVFHHRLAPINTSDSYYLSVDYDSLGAAFQFARTGTKLVASTGTDQKVTHHGSTVYVPLRYIRYIVDWEVKLGVVPNEFTGENCHFPGDKKVSKDYRVKDSHTTTKNSNQKNDDTETIGDKEPGLGLWADVLENIKDNLRLKFGGKHSCGLPFRSLNGILHWALIPDHHLQDRDWHINKWTQFFNASPAVGGGGGSRVWRARYDNRELATPLVIMINQNKVDTRFKNSGYVKKFGSGQGFVDHLIKVINQIYTSGKTPVKPPLWEKRTEEDPGPDMAKYHPLSENPFGFFESYIHDDEVDRYMKQWGSELHDPETSTPVRNLPGPSFEEDFANYLINSDNKKNVNKDDSDQEDNVDDILAPPEQEAKFMQAEETGEDGWAPQANAMTGQIKMEFEKPSRAADNEVQDSGSKEINIKIQTHLTTDEAIFADADCWKKLPEPRSEAYKFNCIRLSSDKIAAAKGTRKGKKSQKQIMGFSASHFADHVLKWALPAQRRKPIGDKKPKDRQMSNGLFMAEWLHLCAYSWGGLLEDGTDHNEFSSQVANNLIFGTSEANSHMTRYETSWQSLFQDEAEIAGKIEKHKVNIQGVLTIERNTIDHRYGYDKSDGNRNYSFEWKNRLFEVHENPDANMISAARRAKMIAYTIPYQPLMLPRGNSVNKKTSFILDEHRADTVRKKTEFFPFSRRFYHRAEYLLDAALYQAMYMLAAKRHCEQDADEMISRRFKFTHKRIQEALNLEEELFSGQVEKEAREDYSNKLDNMMDKVLEMKIGVNETGAAIPSIIGTEKEFYSEEDNLFNPSLNSDGIINGSDEHRAHDQSRQKTATKPGLNQRAKGLSNSGYPFDNPPKHKAPYESKGEAAKYGDGTYNNSRLLMNLLGGDGDVTNGNSFEPDVSKRRNKDPTAIRIQEEKP